MIRYAVFAVVVSGSLVRADEPVRLHLEADPLPFIQSGYGVQGGAKVRGLRGALASFSLDVPAFAAELGGNDDWAIRVRPSAALYVLYYLESGLLFGGSVRVLRLRYSVDDASTDVTEVSPELIGGYQWRPFPRHGFYVQPWFGIAATAWRSDDEIRVGDRVYDPLPLQLFVTVNLGWELVL